MFRPVLPCLNLSGAVPAFPTVLLFRVGRVFVPCFCAPPHPPVNRPSAYLIGHPIQPTVQPASQPFSQPATKFSHQSNSKSKSKSKSSNCCDPCSTVVVSLVIFSLVLVPFFLCPLILFVCPCLVHVLIQLFYRSFYPIFFLCT